MVHETDVDSGAAPMVWTTVVLVKAQLPSIICFGSCLGFVYCFVCFFVLWVTQRYRLCDWLRPSSSTALKGQMEDHDIEFALKFACTWIPTILSPAQPSALGPIQTPGTVLQDVACDLALCGLLAHHLSHSWNNLSLSIKDKTST